ncbi:MAG: primase C-terminal domain-containing protein, partial [Candidatus Pacearchaeota archaeon]
EYNDAPPCLQNIYILNPLTSGNGRNNFLFSFGVYLKKKDEEFFEHKLLSINSHLRDPLDEKEVEKTIINSLKRKDYVYKCKDAPCVDFCNKKECKEREYGIGKNEGYFSNVEFGQLTQYKTHMPYYEWEVRLQGQEIFKKLRFKSEDEIIKQDAFLRLCMRELYEIPSKLKQTEWFKQVNQALKEITIITVDEVEDTSPIVLLKNLIVEFLTGRARAETKEQIKVKRVFYETSTDTYLFRIKDLLEFIFITKQFRMFTPQEIHAILKEMKVMTKFTKTESGKTLRVAMLPRSFIKEAVEEDEFEPDFSHLKEDF